MAESLLEPDLFLDVFDNAPVRELRTGEVLIAAGAPADQVFNVLSGTLMVSRTGRDDRRQVLSFLFRDNFVGLTATDHYFFTVEAVTPARVACCSRAQFNTRLDSDPATERAFLNMMFRVVEDMLDVVYSLGQRSALERLAVFLLYLRHWRRLTDRVGNDLDPVLNAVSLPMSREDIADFLGLKKETAINSIAQALADPQAAARGIRIDLPHPTAGTVPLVGMTIRMSASTPDYRRPPPLLGEHTDEVLREMAGLDTAEIAALRARGVL